MKFAYLILAHKNPKQLLRLVKALDHKNSMIIIHIDAKTAIKPFHKCFNCSFKGKVSFVSNRVAVNWGNYNMIEATMSLVKYFFQFNQKVDYIHLLSGMDYPVENFEKIKAFLLKNKGRNYIDYFSLPDKRWHNSLNRVNYRWGVNSSNNFMFSNLEYSQQYDIQRKKPQDIKLYGGSQWWSLTYDCLKYIYDEFHNKNKIFDYYRFSLIPDEMLFQTLLKNSHFSDSLVNNNLRYIRWTQHCAHPEVINKRDLDIITSKDVFFARKFENYDDETLSLIDIKIGNEINVSKQSRYCVISAVGRNSLHKNWYDNKIQNYDLHLIVYDDSFEDHQQDIPTPYICRGKGQKLQLIYKYLKDNNDILKSYDYFFIPDDDIMMKNTTIMKIFKAMEEYNLAIAQPALINSYYSYPQTLVQHNKTIRFTNFVEMMVPCFSKEALIRVLPTFIENKSGWGADLHWQKLVKSENYNMAIIDSTPVIHTRPILSGNEENRKELDEYMKKHNLSGEIVQYTEQGCTLD